MLRLWLWIYLDKREDATEIREGESVAGSGEEDKERLEGPKVAWDGRDCNIEFAGSCEPIKDGDLQDRWKDIVIWRTITTPVL